MSLSFSCYKFSLMKCCYWKASHQRLIDHTVSCCSAPRDWDTFHRWALCQQKCAYQDLFLFIKLMHLRQAESKRMDSYFPAPHSFIALSLTEKKRHFLFSGHLFLHSPNSSSGFKTSHIPETLDPFSQINAWILKGVDLNWLCSQGCFAASKERSFQFYKSVEFYTE